MVMMASQCYIVAKNQILDSFQHNYKNLKTYFSITFLKTKLFYKKSIKYNKWSIKYKDNMFII